LSRAPESFGSREREGESKKKVWNPLRIFFLPILFLGFGDRFELYAIIVKKIWRPHAFQSGFAQFSEISKKILELLLVFHCADRFEILAIIVISASLDRFSERPCLLLLVSRRDSLVF
jgi:hypothetical protein